MNESTNYLRVAGPADAIDAIVAKVGDGLTPDALVPPPADLAPGQREAWERRNWGIAGISHSGAALLSESNGLKVAEWEFSTRRGLPFALAASMAENDPNLVVALCSVELANGEAEIRVYGNGTEWSYDPDSSEMGDFEQDDAAALDSLVSTAASVIDDYEVAVSQKLGPGA